MQNVSKFPLQTLEPRRLNFEWELMFRNKPLPRFIQNITISHVELPRFLLLSVCCFASGSTYSARLFPVGTTWRAWFTRPLWTQEKDMLARVMAAANVGLSGIGDRLYQNTVRWYRSCVEMNWICFRARQHQRSFTPVINDSYDYDGKWYPGMAGPKFSQHLSYS